MEHLQTFTSYENHKKTSGDFILHSSNFTLHTLILCGNDSSVSQFTVFLNVILCVGVKKDGISNFTVKTSLFVLHSSNSIVV